MTDPPVGPAAAAVAVVAVDTGGTFTDFIAYSGAASDSQLRTLKLPSTPDDPARAVIEGIRLLCGAPAPSPLPADLTLLYGTTVATNAVLERAGADTVLLTTEGFEDVLELARQDRPEIYALQPRRPAPLVPRDRRIGVAERLGPTGAVESALTPAAARKAAEAAVASGAETAAVCLLHSYANDAHERAVAAALRAAGFKGPIALSCDVLPEYREYERTSTTVMQAYVAPKVDEHLRRLQQGLPGTRLLVTQSTGGALSASEARTQAVRTLLSGPAGGVMGAAAVAGAAGHPRIVTFDMGGTSADVAMHQGGAGAQRLTLTTEATVGGLPVSVPMLDIHTVGAGGGSIARKDPGGALVVGPESAGADPGPACYLRGGAQPTVTDAHLLLGRLLPEHFLGGQLHLDPAAARAAAAAAITPLARSLSLTPHQTAAGILRVADATMQRAIKVITLERGHDPRDHTLVSFGGAGGLHAASLAESLGISMVLAPAHPGLLSAYGFLQADLVRDLSQALLVTLPAGVRFRLSDIPRIDEAFAQLANAARTELQGMGASTPTIQLQRSVDLRYQGQSYELTVPIDPHPTTGAPADPINTFHELHAARYGYRHSHRPLELATARLRATAPRPGPPLPPPVPSPTAGRTPPPASLLLPAHAHEALWPDPDGGTEPLRLPTPVYARPHLRPGNRIPGPALICEYSATTAIPPGWRCRVDEFEGLLLRRR